MPGEISTEIHQEKNPFLNGYLNGECQTTFQRKFIRKKPVCSQKEIFLIDMHRYDRKSVVEIFLKTGWIIIEKNWNCGAATIHVNKRVSFSTKNSGDSTHVFVFPMFSRIQPLSEEYYIEFSFCNVNISHVFLVTIHHRRTNDHIQSINQSIDRTTNVIRSYTCLVCVGMK